jgi:4'-phosphopantetheinyl transferase
MIVLYTFIDEHKHNYLLSRYLDTCSESFKNKIMKFRRWQDIQLSLLGRVLLKDGLNDYYNIDQFDIDMSSNNKPLLKGENVHFNISHSNDLVVCVIADFPVGIDVEFLNQGINYWDFQSQMTLREFYEIQNSEDKIKSLFSYWTKKEAVIKADSRGLAIPLDSFEILNSQCLIDSKKFFVKEILVHKDYMSNIASEKVEILDKEILFKRVYF